MKTAIIITTPDHAGLNIKQNLTENYNFTETKEQFEGNTVLELKENPNIRIYTTDKRCIYCENFDKLINADMFIFPTTHRSEAGIASLSVHAPGNWGKAELGGKDGQLCITPAPYLKRAFLELNELGKDSGYKLTLECVHHGPYLEKPVMFLEIGNSPEQWKDKKSGSIIANVLMNTILKPVPNYEIAIGIGGGHYTPLFNKIMLRTNIAIGQICPKYALPYLNKNLLLQAINKNTIQASLAVLDWKGLGKYKHDVVGLLDELNLKYERGDRILK